MNKQAPIWEPILVASFMGGLIGSVLTLTFWEERLWVAIGAILIGVVVAGSWGWMRWEHHRVDIEAKRNKAKLIHASDRGHLFVHDGKVEGYGFNHTPPQPGRQVSGNDALRAVQEPRAPASAEVRANPDIPKTFGELVDRGLVGPGRDFVLGFDERSGEAITMPGLTSLGIGGGQGSGKTVTTLSLMMQAVARTSGGVRFIVSDPHMYVANDQPLMAKAQPLVPFFLTLDEVRETVPDDDDRYHDLLDKMEVNMVTNPVDGGEELKMWMSVVKMEMDRRLKGKRGGTWVIVIDEFGVVADLVAPVLEEINQQARKVDMFALLVSQEWKATRIGGSELRHSIVSFAVHNMPESIASLIVPPNIARQAPTMQVGQAILHSRGVTRVGRVPFATVDDAARIARRYQSALLNGVDALPTGQLILPGDSYGR